MLSLKRKHREPVIYKPSDSNLGSKKVFKCLIMNHPDLNVDIDGATFLIEGTLPKAATFYDGDKVFPIISYIKNCDNEYLPKASGSIKLRVWRATFFKLLPKTMNFKLGENWHYITPDFIYGERVSEQQDSKASDEKVPSVEEFINSLAAGDIYDDVMSMGPEQLAQDLEMPELEVVLANTRTSKIAETINSIVTKIIWALMATIILFAILLYARG